MVRYFSVSVSPLSKHTQYAGFLRWLQCSRWCSKDQRPHEPSPARKWGSPSDWGCAGLSVSKSQVRCTVQLGCRGTTCWQDALWARALFPYGTDPSFWIPIPKDLTSEGQRGWGRIRILGKGILDIKALKHRFIACEYMSLLIIYSKRFNICICIYVTPTYIICVINRLQYPMLHTHIYKTFTMIHLYTV